MHGDCSVEDNATGDILVEDDGRCCEVKDGCERTSGTRGAWIDHKGDQRGDGCRRGKKTRRGINADQRNTSAEIKGGAMSMRLLMNRIQVLKYPFGIIMVAYAQLISLRNCFPQSREERLEKSWRNIQVGRNTKLSLRFEGLNFP